jgi:hypothetical protein
MELESRSDRSLQRLVRRQVPFGLFYYRFQPSGAGPGAMSEAQGRAFGGTGFFIFVPAILLIDRVQICLQSALLSPLFYHLFSVLSIKIMTMPRISLKDPINHHISSLFHQELSLSVNFLLDKII